MSQQKKIIKLMEWRNKNECERECLCAHQTHILAAHSKYESFYSQINRMVALAINNYYVLELHRREKETIQRNAFFNIFTFINHVSRYELINNYQHLQATISVPKKK